MPKPKPTAKKLPGAMIVHTKGFHPVSDDWCPNHPGNLVSFALTEHPNYFCICFWGDDDLGMEKEYPFHKGQRLSTLLGLKWFLDHLPKPLSQKWLKSQGFVSA